MTDYEFIARGEHHRADGTVLTEGDIFEPTEHERRAIPYKMRKCEPDPDAEMDADATIPDVSLADDWHGKMGPVEYLKRYPNGPKAALARKICRAEGYDIPTAD